MSSYLAPLASVAALHLAATAIPGPTTLVVADIAVRTNRRMGLAATTGVACADTAWAVAAMTGISVTLATLTWLGTSLRIVGGGYLVYLGARTWLAARRPPPAGHPGHQLDGRLAALRRGLAANLANPKSAIFFASIFAATLPPHDPVWVRAAAVAIVTINALWWHAALAVLLSRRRAHRAYQKGKHWADRITGGLLTSFGLYLLHQV